MKEMEESNKRREQYMDEMNRERKQKLLEKRKIVERRQHENQIAYQKRETKQLMEYHDRQQRNEQRRERSEEDANHLLQERRRLAELNERRRLMAIEDAQREEEERVEGLLSRQHQADELLDRVQSERKVERRLRKEKTLMKRNQRRLTVQRKIRVEEFKRSQIEAKLAEKRTRTETILRQKKKLLLQRKEASIKAKLQRDRLVDMMAKIRLKKQWNQAESLLTKEFNGDHKEKAAKPKMPMFNATKNHDARMSKTLPELESQHKRASSAAARLQESMQRDTRSPGGPPSNSFASPYDVPQTVILSKPYNARMGHKKKKKRGRRRKKKVQTSSEMLLDSLAQF